MITYKIVDRPSGVECRFCCQREGFDDINDIVILASVGDNPDQQIKDRVAQIDAVISAPVVVDQPPSILATIKDDKERLKWAAVAAIRSDPMVSASVFLGGLPWHDAGIVQSLIHSYAQMAVKDGMIPSAPDTIDGCWDVLVGIVVNLTDEQLREIL